MWLFLLASPTNKRHVDPTFLFEFDSVDQTTVQRPFFYFPSEQKMNLILEQPPAQKKMEDQKIIFLQLFKDKLFVLTQ